MGRELRSCFSSFSEAERDRERSQRARLRSAREGFTRTSCSCRYWQQMAALLCRCDGDWAARLYQGMLTAVQESISLAAEFIFRLGLFLPFSILAPLVFWKKDCVCSRPV